jgi:hypothetical protein
MFTIHFVCYLLTASDTETAGVRILQAPENTRSLNQHMWTPANTAGGTK